MCRSDRETVCRNRREELKKTKHTKENKTHKRNAIETTKLIRATHEFVDAVARLARHLDVAEARRVGQIKPDEVTVGERHHQLIGRD